MLDLPLAALGAHDLGQRADGSFVDIRHLKAGGVHLVACAHGTDDGRARLLGLDHQRNLAGDGVDGIHHVVVLGEIELVLRLRGEEGLVGRDLDVGVDLVDALFRHIHLILPHRLAGGHDLAVQVGQADLIVVDEVQRTHAAAGQCLNGIAAHAANAEHRHAGMVQRFHGFLAQQQLGAGILILHIDTLHFSGPAAPARRSRFSVASSCAPTGERVTFPPARWCRRPGPHRPDTAPPPAPA